MNNKEKQPNNNIIKFILIGSAILLLVSMIVRLFLPSEVDIPLSDFQRINKDGSQSEFYEVINQVSEIEVPDNFSIATYTNNSINFEKVKNDLINNLNLQQNPSVDTIWSNEKWYLNYQPDSNEYILLNLENSEEGHEKKLPNGFNLDQLVMFVENQMKNFLPEIGVSVRTDSIDFWPNEHENYVELSTISEATFADVPLTYTIDGYPIFDKKESTYPFRMTVYSDLSFGKLTYSPFSIDIRMAGNKKSISVEEAVENIRTNRFASIIENFQEQGNELKIEQILSVTFEQVSIEYRIDEEQRLIYPFYKFSGEAETENDILWLEVLTPAIEISL